MKLTSNHSNNNSKYLFCTLSILGGLITTTLVSCLVLSSTFVSADDSAVDETSITVPIACSLSASGTNSHNATINNGQYNSAIGETTMKAFCNDNEGFAIYAVGFTDDEAGKNVLSNSTLGSNHDIATGTAISGDTSNWAMKLAASSGTYAPIIAGSSADTERESGDPDFTSFQAIPNRYTKVAYRTSNTDVGTNAEGSTLTTTYQAYISPTQAAGAYSGKVKYTMIHPNDADAPITYTATLDTGKTVNSKLRSLAATVINGEETTIIPNFDDSDFYNPDNFHIKAISVHLETPVPAGFTPSEKNTISASTSQNPIYIIFDNTNAANVMHFYTEAEQIVLPTDSSYMFYMLFSLGDLSTIANWNSSNVTDMSWMFSYTGQGNTVSTFTLDLSTWDTSNVMDMNHLLYHSGWAATTWSIGDLSGWDTTNVTDMNHMFSSTNNFTTTWYIEGLSSWNTSNVTDMSWMFSNSGNSATTCPIGDFSNWNTSNVTNMSGMFHNANCKTTLSLDLSGWNTVSVTNMERMFDEINSPTLTLNLSSWNTSNVTNMEYMFRYAGHSATTFNLDLSSWNTSNVTNMSGMFESSGYLATTWSVTIPSTNGDGISNTTSNLYGQTTSISGTPPSDKSFTLAQP